MHELGIVSGILETVTAAAREAGASRVVAVSLRIGDLREYAKGQPMDEGMRKVGAAMLAARTAKAED